MQPLCWNLSHATGDVHWCIAGIPGYGECFRYEVVMFYCYARCFNNGSIEVSPWGVGVGGHICHVARTIDMYKMTLEGFIWYTNVSSAAVVVATVAK